MLYVDQETRGKVTTEEMDKEGERKYQFTTLCLDNMGRFERFLSTVGMLDRSKLHVIRTSSRRKG